MKENKNALNIQKGSSKTYSKSSTPKVLQPVESFRVRETKKTMETYGAAMLEELKSKQQKYWPRDCLEKHAISANVRAKMVSLLS